MLPLGQAEYPDRGEGVCDGRGLSSSGTESWEVPGKGIRYVVVNRRFYPAESV
jgi:hypothetical protein